MKQKVRAAMYEGFLAMGTKGLPVDPTLYSLVQAKLSDAALCGLHARADTLPLPPPPQPPLVGRKRSKRAATSTPPPKKAKAQSRFEVEKIVEEAGAWGGHKRWFLVQWKGYDPAWEPWRVSGAKGSPIATWEPLRRMSRTEALAAWDAA